jgi:hypothetical protein
MVVHRSVIPAIQEAEIGGSQLKAGSGKRVRSYLKNNYKQKVLEACSSGTVLA